MLLGGYMSGFFDNEYSGQEFHIQHCLDLDLSPLNMDGNLNSAWQSIYKAISQANWAIENIMDTPDLDDDEKTRLMAESKFLEPIIISGL
jgi:hypothetical protein